MAHEDDVRIALAPDDVQHPLTAREYELEIRLTQVEAEADKIRAQAEQAKITAVGEALKGLVEQPGPKAALEGLGAWFHAQATLIVNQEQHLHEQLMQDKRNGEAQRVRDAAKAGRDQWLGFAFVLGLVVAAVMIGVLYGAGKVDKTAASVAGAFFFSTLQSLFLLAKKR